MKFHKLCNRFKTSIYRNTFFANASIRQVTPKTSENIILTITNLFDELSDAMDLINSTFSLSVRLIKFPRLIDHKVTIFTDNFLLRLLLDVPSLYVLQYHT
jgi:hypothetical protein